jgi:hypothetical protein
MYHKKEVFGNDYNFFSKKVSSFGKINKDTAELLDLDADGFSEF